MNRHFLPCNGIQLPGFSFGFLLPPCSDLCGSLHSHLFGSNVATIHASQTGSCSNFNFIIRFSFSLSTALAAAFIRHFYIIFSLNINTLILFFILFSLFFSLFLFFSLNMLSGFFSSLFLGVFFFV